MTHLNKKEIIWDYFLKIKEVIIVFVFILATFAGMIFWVQSTIDSKVETLRSDMVEIQKTNKELLITAFELKGAVEILRDKIK